MNLAPKSVRYSMRLLLAGLVSVLLCSAVRALPSHLGISQLYHTQWTVLDGAPTGIEALAQTRDGYIWITTSSGLFRFDGVLFERVEGAGADRLLSNNLFALWAPPEGGLWMSYRFGGASFLKDGELTHYSQREGLPPSTVWGFTRDQSGTMWAGATLGLLRLEDGTWVQLGPDWNVPAGTVWALHMDADGTLWAHVGGSVAFLQRGARRFELVDVELGNAFAGGIMLSRGGVPWLLDSERRRLWEMRAADRGTPLDARRHTRLRDTAAGTFMRGGLVDRDRNLWFAIDRRLYRMRVDHDDAALQSQADSVTLTGDPFSWLEDREGNVWIGTSGGLDKFRAPALAKVDLKVAPGFFLLAAAKDGGAWIGTQDAVDRYSRGRPDAAPPIWAARAADPDLFFDCLYADPVGGLWLGMQNEIWHFDAGKWTASKRPDVRIDSSPVGQVQAMAMDQVGALWVSVVRVGVYRVADGKWSLWGDRTDLLPEPATVLTADARGRLWLGYVENRIGLLEDGRVRTFTSSDGLQVGTVLAVAVRGENVWVGGERGAARFDGRAFHAVKWQGRGTLTSVTGIVEMADGDLWLSTGDGAVHVAAAEVKALRTDPNYPVQHTLLNHLDGMPGAPLAIRPLPSIAMSNDGLLWFATVNGVVWIDPERMMRNEIVPTVLVNGITADGTHHELWSAATPTRLPPKTRNLQISYTATSLTIPERVQFRYRLEGNDSKWQDVGTRREAYFTDLAPGKYRFRVIAANNDGLWNETGATVEFVIPPTFLQSRWFLAICVAAGLCIIAMLFQLRLRQAKARLRWRLEGRMVERERIARDLHDTFLQSVQGLMLRFQNAAEHIVEREPARQLMEQALDRADQVLAEGRDTVSALRASTQAETALSEALKELGDGLSQDHGVAFALSVDGAPRPLHPIVREEAFRVGAQAITNAFQHAHATRIEVQIIYRRKFVLHVKDDGQGFDTSTSPPTGHWGLKGMRERAARIRAKLAIASRIGEGTSIELQIPARVAFKP